MSQSVLGIGNASGSPAYTVLGNSLAGMQQSQQTTHRDSIKIYQGWLEDIDFDTSEERHGNRIKIRFDLSSLNSIYRDRWFRLGADTVTLLQNYGTRESILSQPLRVNLEVQGMSFTNGIASIIGDERQSRRFVDHDKTPVRAWADIINGLTKDIKGNPKERKIFRISKEGPFIEVSSDYIKIGYDETNFVIINSGGITTQGKMNHQGSPQDNSFYGFFKMQNEFLGLIPGAFSPSQYVVDLSLFKVIPSILALAKTFSSINGY